MSTQDPYAKYGGAAAADPYVKYGGGLDATAEQAKPSVVAPPMSIASQLLSPVTSQIQNLRDLVIGAGKGLESTVHEGGQLLRNTFPSLNNLPQINYTRPQPPTTMAQSVGKGAEQLAEFAIPGTRVAEATKAAPLLARMAAQAATAGTVGAMQGQTAPEVALTAVTAGTLPALGTVASALKEKAAPIVNRWLQVAPKEMEYGANPGMRLVKEGLVKATKAQTQQAIQPALDNAGSQLGAKLTQATSQGTIIDASQTIMDALDTATKTIGKRSDKAFQAALTGVFDDVTKEFPDINALTPLRAQQLKIAIGDAIKWHGVAYEGDVNAALVDIYRGLNTAIKDNVKGVADLQSRWGDLYLASKAIGDSLTRDAAGVGTGNINPILKRAGGAAATAATAGGVGYKLTH